MSGPGRLLAIDYGKVRLGLAISDPERQIASPLLTYTRRNPLADAGFFQDLVRQEAVCKFVVGLPVHTDGREGELAALARQFGRWLGQAAGLPIVFWDERFSSQEAEEFLRQAGLSHKKRKSRRDPLAAQIFLQAYLDAGCPEKEPEIRGY